MSNLKPGRPSTSPAERAVTRARIDRIALRLFTEESFKAVSMRRLAQEAGFSTMKLYSYYENKVDILTSLWAKVFDDLFKDLLDKTAKISFPADKLSAMSIAYVDYWLTHPDHYRMVFMAEGITQPDVTTFLDRPETAHKFSAFGNLLHAGLGSALTEASRKTKLDFLICTLHGIAHCKITMSGYEWASTDILVQQAVDTVLNT